MSAVARVSAYLEARTKRDEANNLPKGRAVDSSADLGVIFPLRVDDLHEVVDELLIARTKLEAIRDISNGWVDSEEIDAILRGEL